MRDKIFQICSLLHEQQKRAGANLAYLETKVTDLRRSFTGVILGKNHWETKESVNRMFTKSEELEMARQFSSL